MQAGVISHAQLREHGLSQRQIDTLRSSGRLVVAHNRVYRASTAPDGYKAALWTAQLTTRGTLGFNTGCHLWDMLPDAPAPITVLIDEPRRVSAPRGVRVRRRSQPVESQILHGLRVTPRATSLLDHLSDLPRPEARTLFDRGLQKGWITPDDIARRLSWPMWGNGQLRELAKVLGDGAVAASERLLHALLRDARMTGWVPNLSVLALGVRCVVDVAFPEQRVAIEVDGMAYHTDVERFQRDRTRQNALIATGWTVLRFTWWDLTERPDYVIRTIAAAVSSAA